MSVRVVSFYSPDYVDCAMQLARSCDEFGIDREIDAVPIFPSWADGVSFKPQFIYQKLQSIPDGSGMLWTDADSQFRSEPDWSIFNAIDFSACLFQWSPAHALEMLTGTVFFRKSPRVVDFVKRWMLATPTWRKANVDTPEQLSLKETWERQLKDKHPLRFLDLPKEWVYIQPDFQDLYPKMVPRIEHLQASRRLKR